eukprot:4377058-Prymnesium_polylepis.2
MRGAPAVRQEEEPDAGVLEVGPTVQLGYVSQTRRGLDPNKSVFQEVSQARAPWEARERHIGT